MADTQLSPPATKLKMISRSFDLNLLVLGELSPLVRKGKVKLRSFDLNFPASKVRKGKEKPRSFDFNFQFEGKKVRVHLLSLTLYLDF